MSASVPPASNNIFESIEKLRHLSRVEVQSGWRYSDADSALSEVNICNWQIAELNEKGHIAWPAGKQVLQLGQLFVVPNNLQGYPVTGMRLLLSLTWWAEDAQIFVNGELVGQGDLFDCADRVLLSSSATSGEQFLVILRLVSPGHDCGALVRSICLYEAADSDCFDPGFVADELEILQNSLTRNWEVLNLPHSSTEILADRAILVQRETLQSEIYRQVGLIDWSALPDRSKFDRSLSILRQNLLGYLRNFPGDLEDGTAEGAEGAERKEKHRVFAIGEGGEKFSTSIYIGEGGEKLSKFRGLKPPPKNLTVNCLKTSIYIGEIYLLGHAHLDLAWLWPIEETWSAAERTFESVLKLQAEFPDLIFCHSTPALYAWIEEHRPDLFAAIQKQVIAGRWEVVGGMWVEPDLNLISGESMVRQVIYGQRYAQEKFGELMRVAWLPDTFGFGWQLPQILRQGGVEYFVTQKLRWNDSTEFPYGVFWWEGLDGTKIFSMMSGPIGESTEAVKMANHAFDWQVKTGLQAAFWLPGVGDHGGGPTRDMLAVAKRWEKSPFFPKLQFGKAVDYLSSIESLFSPGFVEAESQADVLSRENQQFLAVGEVVGKLGAIESPNFAKISESEFQADVSIRNNQQILAVGEVVGKLGAIESPNFAEISESEFPADVLSRENKPILELGEVVENLDAIESPNFAEISESEFPADVLSRENKPILELGEVVENLDAIESPNFAKISESEFPADVLIRNNQQILKLGEVRGNQDAIESPNFAEISESESEGDVLSRNNQQILELGEVGENLDAIESPNFTEIYESEFPADVLSRENKPILELGEVVEKLGAIESPNFAKISESEFPGDVSIRNNQQILAVGEVVENLDAIESPNFAEISESEFQADVSIRNNQQILKLGEVGGNKDAIESPNLTKISESESEGDVSIQNNQQILAVGEVVEKLGAIESPNFAEISESEFPADVLIRNNQQILKLGEVGGNKDAIESPNFAEISESEFPADVLSRENKPILELGEVVENLDAIESPNFAEISESESEDKASSRENQQILELGEVVGNQDAIESPNFAEISESEFPADVSIRNNQQILAVGEVVENQDAIESPNFAEISESESEDKASSRENQQILKLGEVGGNQDAIESPNLTKISESESEGDVSIQNNQQILAVGEVVGKLGAIESPNFAEISDFEFQADVSIRNNQQILAVGEVVENQDAIESPPLPLPHSPPLPLSPSSPPPLPIWKDELYLEFHRGCYTTRADQKRQNRRCEELLYQAELLSSIATICTGAVYPKSELETAWKQVLFNQFHDILPGSAIAQVYADANLAFAEADRTCREIMAKSLDAIATQISLPSPPQPDAQPIFIFNSLNWSRSEVVAVPIPDSAAETWQIYDLSGQRLATQISRVDRPEAQFTLLFSANNLPAVGYLVFWLCRAEAETLENSLPATQNSLQTDLVQVTNNVPPKLAVCQETHFEAVRKVLENEFIRATIDGETGNLSSIWDKVNNREVLNTVGGDRLQAFQDSGQYWDAWNIDPNYQKHQLPPPLLKDIFWVDQGEVRQSLRVTRQIGKSVFCQDYIVEIGSPLLKIKTVVDWQETHVLVKTAFGLNQSADFATCEIPCGAIDRTTKPQTAAEKAKWEVPILRWADISNDGFGVSLLNDCKYGCDLQPNQLRLTLLRGSTWPDEQADIGIHEFTYAVYPHRGNWQNAGTVRRGYELNLPPLVQVFPQLEENRNKTLPAVGKLLDLSAKNLVLMAFKQSEDDANLWILRCYESEGKQAVLELDSDLGLAISQPVDLLEQRVNSLDKSDDEKGFKILPWKIASFAVNRSGVMSCPVDYP
jgi:alpha-mannosidase